MMRITKGVYHLPTQEKWDGFFKQAEKQGIKWEGSTPSFKKYETDSCIIYKKDTLMYSGKQWYLSEGYTIKQWNPEFTKSDLQSDDVVVYRNDVKRLVFKPTKTLHFKDGDVALEFDSFNENLTHKTNKLVDIMQVYRNGEKIFDREEKSEHDIEIEKIQEEMTKLQGRMDKLKGAK